MYQGQLLPFVLSTSIGNVSTIEFKRKASITKHGILCGGMARKLDVRSEVQARFESHTLHVYFT